MVCSSHCERWHRPRPSDKGLRTPRLQVVCPHSPSGPVLLIFTMGAREPAWRTGTLVLVPPPPTAARAPRGPRPAGPDAGRRITVRSAVGTFVVADLVAIVVIALVVTWLVNRRTTSGAVRDARDLTVAEGRAAVWPLLTDGVASGDPVALTLLDDTVRRTVLSDRIVRVKIWSAQGRVLYSDEARLIGKHFDLGTHELQALTTGRPAANVSDLAEPENLYERQFHKLLQVYEGLRTPGGQPVLFESYLRFSSVSADSHRTLISLLPAMFAGLLLLFLAQVPLAWTMARRLERARVEEQRLLVRTLESAELERRHIAADLHDGPVQSLAGTAMSLTAAATQAKVARLDSVATTVGLAAAELRQGIRDLRTLIVAIAPPRLHDEGLAAALEDLISPLQARGVEATLIVPDDLTLDRHVEALTYRAAQEAMRNVTQHARGAAHVTVLITHERARLLLAVTDDGPGFSPETVANRQSEGHLGLHLLSKLAQDAGGCLDVRSHEGAGTTLTLELPL